MVTVEIEFCVPCGLLDPAMTTQRELLETFGQDLDRISLATGHGGVFKVTVDSDLVYDKAEHGTQIDLNEIKQEVDARIGPEA